MDAEEQHDIQDLNAALILGDITIEELWLAYIAIGGYAGEHEIEEYLRGLVSLRKLQRELLKWAVEELSARVRLSEPLTPASQKTGRQRPPTQSLSTG